MKQLTLLYFFAFLYLSAAVSCKKDPVPESAASLTIINALPGSQRMITDFTGKPAAKFSGEELRIDYGIYNSGCHLAIPVKEQSLFLYQFPFTTEGKPLYKLGLNPAVAEISTLFLMGTMAQPEHLLVVAKPPYYSVKDSLMGLRFVNLSAGSGPVNVRISGQGLSTAISSNNIAYKGITAYLPVPATFQVGDLQVEFYDQASGNLLGTYSLPEVGATLTDNPWRYRNYTLALIGLPNAANAVNAQKVMQVNDY